MPCPASRYGALGCGDVDAGDDPQCELRGVGAGAVVTRHERRALCLDRLQRGGDVLALHASGTALRPDQHIVAVHHIETLHGKAVHNELLLLRPRMHQHDVGLTFSGSIEHLVGAPRDHLDVDTGFVTEHRQEMIEQAELLRRCGRGQHNQASTADDATAPKTRPQPRPQRSAHATDRRPMIRFPLAMTRA